MASVAPNRSRIPSLAITIGDPGGIGPEIVARALANPFWVGKLKPIVIGGSDVVKEVIAGCRLDLSVHVVSEVADVEARPGTIEIVECGNLGRVNFGTVDARQGRAALDYIERACDLVVNRQVQGLVTGPISKEAIWAAGSPYPGHTEMLGALLASPAKEIMTMFELDTYRIFFLTRHLSLRDAISALSLDETVNVLCLVDKYLRRLGVPAPRIALPALNPHCGENGNMGREELDILSPAVVRARDFGVNVTGPIASDAAFFQARMGRFDAVLALFHDQGHIAAKTVDFFGTVACELGLPVIRTSVDHGTAFDIAGTWSADATAQVAALQVAAKLAPLVGAR